MAKREASENAAAAETQAAPAVQESEFQLLDQIVNEGRLARDETTRERGRGLISEFVKQILEGQMTVAPDTEAMIHARIAQIDHLLSLQLNEVLHHPKFQKLEATWRGINYLLENSETGVNLKLKVLNATKKEVLRDLQRVPEFDQSQMFKKVYEQEFGVFGGEPFACLLGDYEFGKGPEDIEFGADVAGVGGGARAVPLGRGGGFDEPGVVHATGLSPRPGEDLRHHRIRALEGLPPVGGLALCLPDLAAHSDARALRKRHQDGGRFRL
jgi:predicted component of type VI protein secretion system